MGLVKQIVAGLCQVALLNDGAESMSLPEGLVLMAFGKISYKKLTATETVDTTTDSRAAQPSNAPVS